MQTLLIVPLAEPAISLDGLAEGGHHFQVAEGALVDRPHRVVHEVGRDKQGKREYFRVIFCVFLQAVSALSVKEEDVVVLCGVEGGFRPHPDTLRAAGDRRVHLELNYEDVLLLFQSVATAC